MTTLLPIRVRGFVPPTPSKQSGETKRRNAAPPSEWTLIFDCETQVDAGQNLRFGVYQIRKAAELEESGLFYNPEALTPLEVEVWRRIAAERGAELQTRDEFIDKVFYGIAYDLRASIVGFNLPFDLSRLAIRHGPARGNTMRGGFSFQLSQNPWRARIQVKHLSARSVLIQFTKPRRRDDTRRARRKRIISGPRRGSFLDVKTIAAALLSRSFSLELLAEFLGTQHRKRSTDEHGGPLTPAYLYYAVDDVQVTWECYQVLLEKLRGHAFLHQRNAALVHARRRDCVKASHRQDAGDRGGYALRARPRAIRPSGDFDPRQAGVSCRS